MNETKVARPDHPVQDVISERWSPYVFSRRAVSRDDLRSLFEAARWAASSYNEQPWRYLVATRDDNERFDRMLSCLVDANRAWAEHAPVVALGVVRLNFARNGEPNRAAHHDLGLATGNLLIEATTRGVSVHQMIGIRPDHAREVFAIPEGFEAFTALALGYAGESGAGPEALRARDEAPRSRRPLGEFVFGDRWDAPAFNRE